MITISIVLDFSVPAVEHRLPVQDTTNQPQQENYHPTTIHRSTSAKPKERLRPVVQALLFLTIIKYTDLIMYTYIEYIIPLYTSMHIKVQRI